MLTRPSTRLVAFALAGGITLVACGGGGGGDKGGAAPVTTGREAGATVEVTAVDINFPKKGFTAKAGPVKFVYRNEGRIRHTLVIEEVPAFDKLEVNANGDTDEGTVELDPGTYTIFCEVPGHRPAGMEGKVVVS